MKIKHEKFIVANGWQYWIDTCFAILPVFIPGGAFPIPVWFRRYWQTYPVDADGHVVEMYRVTFKDDPRKKEGQQ